MKERQRHRVRERDRERGEGKREGGRQRQLGRDRKRETAIAFLLRMMVWSQVARARHPQRLLSASGGAKEKNSFRHTAKVEFNAAVGILYCMVLYCTALYYIALYSTVL